MTNLTLYLEEVHAEQQEKLLERSVLHSRLFLGFLLQVCHRLQHTVTTYVRPELSNMFLPPLGELKQINRSTSH